MLRLFDEEKIGEGLLRADRSMTIAEAQPYQYGSIPFILFYIVGIFVIFGVILWRVARPQRNKTRWLENKNMQRFGLLYSSYEPRCWG